MLGSMGDRRSISAIIRHDNAPVPLELAEDKTAQPELSDFSERDGDERDRSATGRDGDKARRQQTGRSRRQLQIGNKNARASCAGRKRVSLNCVNSSRTPLARDLATRSPKPPQCNHVIRSVQAGPFFLVRFPQSAKCGCRVPICARLCTSAHK